jgi:hypothetical protein
LNHTFSDREPYESMQLSTRREIHRLLRKAPVHSPHETTRTRYYKRHSQKG